MKSFDYILIISLLSLQAPVFSQTADLATLPPHLTPTPHFGERHATVTHNLGPIGARGWIYGEEGHTLDSREILITSVQPGGPSAGVLLPYDIIVGAACPPDVPAYQWEESPAPAPFAEDARMSFARAIIYAESEAGGGKLRLLRHRDGVTREVFIPLPVLGDYSRDTPFQCDKSAELTRRAAEMLAGHMPAQGFPVGIGDPMNAAFLLATGDAAYLDHVRRSACRMSVDHRISSAGMPTWRWGHTNTFLCEYYLATGDERVLPTIREFAQRLNDGQCNPGTWGHRPVPDFVPPGYGSLNSSGLVCFYSLILAHRIGIDVADASIERSIRFYGSYTGRGSIPYGDHPPVNPNSSNNGKNAVAAMAFDILGAKPASQWFARLTCSSNLYNMENGHTGNSFNQYWSPLGAYLAGRENCSRFWDRLHPYRDLTRTCDHGFMTQPWPDPREGQLSMINYVNRGPLWNTGAFSLGYLSGNKRLALLGRRGSIFAANPPEALRPALDRYRAKDFQGAIEWATPWQTKGGETINRLAGQLIDISRLNLESIKHTLESMRKNREKGDFYTLGWQLKGIESLIDAEDERLRDLRAALESATAPEVMEDGAAYDAATKDYAWAGPAGYQTLAPKARADLKAREALETIAAKDGSPYQSAARAHLEAYPLLQTTPGVTLMPGADHTQAWKVAPASLTSPPSLWTSPEYDDKRWQSVDLAKADLAAEEVHYLRGTFTVDDPNSIQSLFMTHHHLRSLKVYLNGELILDARARDMKAPIWDTKPMVMLKPSNRKLLKPGRNTLAASFISSRANAPITLLAITTAPNGVR